MRLNIFKSYLLNLILIYIIFTLYLKINLIAIFINIIFN